MRVLLTLVAFFTILLFPSCQEEKNEESIPETTDSSAVDEVEELIKESENYLQDRDFDGDQFPDAVSFSYSGGAHCCYQLRLKLSSMSDTLQYPFEMDGGYGFGIVDGSQADQFCVEDVDGDGLPEIFMMISTYNAEVSPIDKEWTKEYGITSNYIIFDYANGKVHVMDYDSTLHKIPLKPRL